MRVLTAGAPPAAATIQRVEGEFGWELTHVYGLTETAPFITVCEPRPEHAELSLEDRSVVKARQGVELITSGELRVVDEDDTPVPRDAQTLGEIVVRGNVVMAGYYDEPGRHGAGDAGRAGSTAATRRWCTPTGMSRFAIGSRTSSSAGGENISSVEVEGILMRQSGRSGSGGGRPAGPDVGRDAPCVRGAGARCQR